MSSVIHYKFKNAAAGAWEQLQFEGAAMSVILNKGEVCLAGSRVFVHEKVKNVFLDKFQANLRKVQLGDPKSPTRRIGTSSETPSGVAWSS